MTDPSNYSKEDRFRQSLLDQAIAFFTAGSRCNAAIGMTPLITNHPVAPAVVLFAFSVELYLKLLRAISNGEPSKIHGLRDLFMGLPDTTRELMNSHYGSAESCIETDICKVDSVFVDWRYIHESTTPLMIEPEMLVRIATSAHITCKKLMPELKVHGENYHLGGWL